MKSYQWLSLAIWIPLVQSACAVCKKYFRKPMRYCSLSNNGKVINMGITLFHDLKILINWICVVYCLEHVRLRFDINIIIISCLIKRDSRRVSISLRFCFKSYFSIFLKWCVNRLSFLPPLFAPCFDSSILLRHRSEHYHVDAISNTTIIDKLTYGLYSFESSMFNLIFHTVD